ncbi:MAG: hypothetical protein LBQ39_10810 [Tannerellaceae bacterium]|jgi:hypothetical protein|nr:hypothetical protein [Tannerellaceae bacterium]
MNIYLDTNQNPLPQLMLPAGFAPELSRTNPFLTDMGSQSIPLTLPASDHNMKLLGFLHRGTSTTRPSWKVDAIMQHGGVYMRGVLMIDSANKMDGITCTFYTNEGQLYEKMNGIKMGDLTWQKEQYSSVPALINVIKEVMRETSFVADYFIFPAMTSNQVVQEGKSDYLVNFILNETISTNGLPATISFKGEQEREWNIDNQKIKLPVGYGITPFLRVSYILRILFYRFGYSLNTNMFDTHSSLKRLVLLNNTADAICAGYIDYKQLIPEQLDVMDFINMIRKKFGVEFIERAGGRIDVVTWTGAITGSFDRDLSEYVVGHPVYKAVEPTAIAIQMNRALEPYASVEGTSRDDLLKKYGQLEVLNLDVLDNYLAPGTLYLIKSRMQYLLVLSSWHSDWTNEKSLISSPFWDKANDTGLPSEDIEPGDFSVPMVKGDGTIDNGGISGYHEFVMPYIGGIRNLNSAVTMNDAEATYEEEKEDLQMMLCFSVPGWRLATESTGSGTAIITFQRMGSSFCYTMNGADEWGTLNLMFTEENNLYDAFYTHRDAMLRHANQIVELSMKLSAEDIVGMDLSVPKIINGMKVLIEQIDFVLGREDVCRVTARTLHQFEE